MMLLDVTYQAACGAVFYSCFCRFVRMDSRTRLAIRAAFWLLSLASIVCMVAPALGWGQPTWLMVVLLAGIAAVQAATSYYWRDGTPQRLVRPDRGES